MSRTIPKFTQDPDARLDYTLTWELPSGDVISESTWESEDEDLIVENDTFTDTEVTVWVRGGVPGQQYSIVNHIVTQAGREDDQTVRVKIKEL
jgi:hypothetical protein